MTTIKYKRTIIQTVDRVVPDYFGCDDSPLGRAVDYLLKDYEHRGRTVRDQVFEDQGDAVETAIDQLERAYETARGVAYAMGVLKQVGGEVHKHHGTDAEAVWKKQHEAKQ